MKRNPGRPKKESVAPRDQDGNFVKPKRGRPPKHLQAAALLADPREGAAGPLVNRKRGRPKKEQPVVMHKSAADGGDTAAVVERKRGRPPKRMKATTFETRTQPPMKRKRSRPKKGQSSLFFMNSFRSERGRGRPGKSGPNSGSQGQEGHVAKRGPDRPKKNPGNSLGGTNYNVDSMQQQTGPGTDNKSPDEQFELPPSRMSLVTDVCRAFPERVQLWSTEI